MEIRKTLYVKDKAEWRNWLLKNADKEKEVWLIFPSKSSGEKKLPYNDAVDEAMCFGWIDSTVKKLDEKHSAQRFTPRRDNSPVSEMNKERARRLIKEKRMTPEALAKIQKYLDEKFVMPEGILARIKKNKKAWENFTAFPEYYKHIRIAYIGNRVDNPREFEKRFSYFMKKTEKNERFGLIR
jgi:uncharacterized protein YdeI (YjbR/CyaY-like superfamily)